MEKKTVYLTKEEQNHRALALFKRKYGQGPERELLSYWYALNIFEAAGNENLDVKTDILLQTIIFAGKNPRFSDLVNNLETDLESISRLGKNDTESEYLRLEAVAGLLGNPLDIALVE